MSRASRRLGLARDEICGCHSAAGRPFDGGDVGPVGPALTAHPAMDRRDGPPEVAGESRDGLAFQGEILGKGHGTKLREARNSAQEENLTKDDFARVRAARSFLP